MGAGDEGPQDEARQRRKGVRPPQGKDVSALSISRSSELEKEKAMQIQVQVRAQAQPKEEKKQPPSVESKALVPRKAEEEGKKKAAIRNDDDDFWKSVEDETRIPGDGKKPEQGSRNFR